MTGIIILVVLAAGYGCFYYLNHKTPVPKGCENLKQACHGCKDFSCGNHPSQN
ncbi:hypothetical protein [Traorella massiliensis]|uniref:hypothetical protein n=1 Tax=Traorella massiliensis TaxID=1903263 RepID=UPI000AFD6BD5|nr:hypothetical protein [Traorella massiliensis]